MRADGRRIIRGFGAAQRAESMAKRQGERDEFFEEAARRDYISRPSGVKGSRKGAFGPLMEARERQDEATSKARWYRAKEKAR